MYSHLWPLPNQKAGEPIAARSTGVAPSACAPSTMEGMPAARSSAASLSSESPHPREATAVGVQMLNDDDTFELL